jgi:hypothetical protein
MKRNIINNKKAAKNVSKGKAAGSLIRYYYGWRGLNNFSAARDHKRWEGRVVRPAPSFVSKTRHTHISSSSSSQTISTHNYIACCPFLYVYIYNAYCAGPMKRPMIAPYAIAI